METRVSTRGQIVLPGPLRRKLGIRTGDPLDVRIEAGRIVLTPRGKLSLHPAIIADPVTGYPVLSAGPDAPILTSEEVADMLVDFP